MAADSSTVDDYILGRGYAAATRLNLQHYLWVKAFDGHLLLPSIPFEGRGLKIADVATGTGIWLLDIAEQARHEVKLEGLDISLAQTPHKDWVPSNISFRKYDVLAEPEEDLLERYDIVHCVIPDTSCGILGRVQLTITEPGGYIQWGEHDTVNRKTVTATSACSKAALDKLKDRMYDFLYTPNATWPSNLDSFFLQQGIQDVKLETRWTDNAYACTHQEVALMVYEELISVITAKPTTSTEEQDELRSLFKQAIKESEGGAAWNIAKIYVTGRKPTK